MKVHSSVLYLGLPTWSRLSLSVVCVVSSFFQLRARHPEMPVVRGFRESVETICMSLLYLLHYPA